MTYRIFRQWPACVLLLVLLALSFQNTLANRQFGIVYQQSETRHLTEEEIAFLQSSGVRWLLLEDLLGGEQRGVLPSNFSLLVMIPEYFPVPYRLTDEKYGYTVRADSLMRAYRDDIQVAGIGLFAYGAWEQGSLPDRLDQLARPHLADRFLFTLDSRPFPGNDLTPFDRILLTTRNAAQLKRQLKHNPSLAGVLYTPTDPELNLRDFQNVMILLENHREVPVFFYRSWFTANSGPAAPDSRYDISRITRLHHEVPDARIARPPPSDTDYHANISMFLLFFLWVFFAAWYRLRPIYRRSVSRIFVSYDFFVDDVLMRRVRFTSDAVMVFFFTCFLAGIMGFAIADLFLDPVARQVLLRYSVMIEISWVHPIVYFILSFSATALLLTVKIIWLFIANSRHARASQIATFILWPQHLNILVTTAGVIILRSFPSAAMVLVMTGTFIAVTVLSFFTTAYNMRRIYPTSLLYMTTTYALFVLVTVSIASWMVFGLDLIQAWELAVSLSSIR